MNKIKALYTGQPYDPEATSIPVSDWDFLYDDYSDTHLRQSALDTVIGKIKSTSNLIKFDTKDIRLSHKLNVKPNSNDNKSDFRNKVIDNMLLEGECLVIQVNGEFYVADSFTRNETVFGQKRYESIVVDNLALRRTFPAEEVFHFRYPNNKLKRFLNDLDESYAKLFTRLIDVHMRNNQIRLYAEFAQTQKDGESQQKFVKFLRGVETKIRDDSIAVIPTQQDWKLTENAQNYESRSITEVGDLENMYVRQVANILQVPPLLFSGDLADVSQHKDSYIKDCIRPLMEIIASEINAKYFSAEEYSQGETLRVNAVHALYNTEFEMGAATEKMVGSGVWTIDMILEAMGKEPVNSVVTTQRYLTKNIAPINGDGTVDT